MEQIAQILAIQSYDWINSRTGNGSRTRIRAACDFISSGLIPEDCTAIFPQGYQKENPRYGEPDQQSLGENMAAFAMQQEEMKWVTFDVKPMSWTTAGDILATYERVRELGHSKAHIFFVSDPDHLWRVRLVWYMTHPKGWTAQFCPAIGHTMPIKDIFAHEIPGILIYFIKLFPRLVNRLRN